MKKLIATLGAAVALWVASAAVTMPAQAQAFCFNHTISGEMVCRFTLHDSAAYMFYHYGGGGTLYYLNNNIWLLF